MLTKVIKITKLSFAFLGVILLLTGTPALAQPSLPTHSQPTIAAVPAAAPISINLCARTGTVTMPDGTLINIWGYVHAVDAAGLTLECDNSLIASLPPQLPGPILRVSEGDEVTITLHNELDVPTSIIFPGQTPDWLPSANGDQIGTFTEEAAASGGTATYAFTAHAPGTYLYESGTTDQPQVSMGLYGALIVDPATPGQAYSSGDTAYDNEAILVLSEIDPALNADVFANPTTFTYDLLEYHPTYWLINGRAYGPGNSFPDVLDPDVIFPTDPYFSQPYSSAISMDLSAGEDTLLVRYLNVGGIHHTMSLLGLYQRIIAKDADELTGGQAYDAVAETIPSGQTTDAIIGFLEEGEYALFNRQLHITNGTAADSLHFAPGGGMMTFISATGAVPVLDLNAFTIESYGADPGPSQDATCTSATVEDAGATLHLLGNCWKKIALAQTVNHAAGASTVIEFDFSSPLQGEIHAIGFDVDDNVNNAPIRAFELYGTQTWGIKEQNHNPYTGAGGWQHYKIWVGQHYTGTMTHLVFANDSDPSTGGSPIAEGYFRNIQIYEAPPPLLNVNGTGYLVESYGGAQDNSHAGTYSAVVIEDSGNKLRIIGNGWKQVKIPYNVTNSTVLDVDFESGVEGEIHGIGFDTDDDATNSPIDTFQLHGTQTFGFQTYNNYAGETPKSYNIDVVPPVTAGPFTRLIFANDHDVDLIADGEGVFSNISIHE